eukprot:2515414-Rhodomonas_salina.1
MASRRVVQMALGSDLWVGGGGDRAQVPAMVLANLCVSYIMTSLNEKAEDLLRQVQRHAVRQSEEPARVLGG